MNTCKKGRRLRAGQLAHEICFTHLYLLVAGIQRQFRFGENQLYHFPELMANLF